MRMLAFPFRSGMKKNDSDYMDFSSRLAGLKILAQFLKPLSCSTQWCQLTSHSHISCNINLKKKIKNVLSLTSHKGYMRTFSLSSKIRRFEPKKKAYLTILVPKKQKRKYKLFARTLLQLGIQLT